MAVLIRNIQAICTAPEGINLVVVKVETTEPGLYGLGCATFAYRHLAVKCVVEDYLRPLLVGQDAGNIEQLWQLMHQNAYWRNGPIENNAISGVDMALWDIKGKMAGMPLYQLFGGKLREGVAVYRHADGRDWREVVDNIARYRDQGVTRVRCQCGGYGGGGFGPAPVGSPERSPDGVYLNPRKYMRETLEMFEKVREAYGDSIELCHDIHERITPRDAIRFVTELEPFKLFFVEDAMPLEDLGWFRELRAKTLLPLAQGELFNNPYEWKTLFAEKLIDYIRVHLSQIGGITPGRKLQLFAEQHGIRTAWHGPGDMSPLAHAANIHLDVSAVNFGLQEWSGAEAPNHIIQELKGPPGALLDVFPGLPECRNGYVYPNDRPGLGVDLNEEEAKKYPCENTVTTWTQTRMPDGSLTVP